MKKDQEQNTTEILEAMQRYAHLPRTRQEAIDKKIDKYFTGRPCRSGHLSPRYTKWGTCVACAAESAIRRTELAKRAFEEVKEMADECA